MRLTCSCEDIAIPHHHPGDVGKEGTGGRENGEWRIGKHSQGILLSGSCSAPANKNCREQGQTQNYPFDILKLGEGCGSNSLSLHPRNVAQEILFIECYFIKARKPTGSRTWTKPNGQAQPQKTRPTVIAVK